MTLAELSKITADPLSMLSAVKLFFIRLRIWGGAHSRFVFFSPLHLEKTYIHTVFVSQKFFYIIVLFIVVVTSVAGGLAFALGRIIDITTTWTFEARVYDEVPMFGDLFDSPNAQDTVDELNVSAKCWYCCA
jgi:hypothetical protein